MTKKEIIKSIIDSLNQSGIYAYENSKGGIELSIHYDNDNKITYGTISQTEIKYQLNCNK